VSRGSVETRLAAPCTILILCTLLWTVFCTVLLPYPYAYPTVCIVLTLCTRCTVLTLCTRCNVLTLFVPDVGALFSALYCTNSLCTRCRRPLLCTVLTNSLCTQCRRPLPCTVLTNSLCVQCRRPLHLGEGHEWRVRARRPRHLRCSQAVTFARTSHWVRREGRG
jgi:hypothetical protein